MSVSGISSSNLFNYSNQSIQNNLQRFQQEFQQLGQDLQNGNVTAAQQDFATLQQLGPQASSTLSTQTSDPMVQAFNQLGQDLQSGNVSAAQKDYTNLKQDFQNAAHTRAHHHHQFRSGDSGEMSQLFEQLGQALQSGNVSSAQTAYSSLLQDLPQLGQNNQLASALTSTSNANSVSITA
jgi:outer membrane protein assembly factor BamD (BamD/ComL family)